MLSFLGGSQACLCVRLQTLQCHRPKTAIPLQFCSIQFVRLGVEIKYRSSVWRKLVTEAAVPSREGGRGAQLPEATSAGGREIPLQRHAPQMLLPVAFPSFSQKKPCTDAHVSLMNTHTHTIHQRRWLHGLQSKSCM